MSEYSSKLESKDMDFLFEGILSLQTKEECYRFFEDICTINEIKAFEQRFQIATMLVDKRTYIDITGATGASTATISRINRALNYGSDGYKLILERLKLKK
ncbi:YerC/YecD family TrpR-related protein [Clostridium estertheticum]|uniref:TrpR-like protein YerC/YecD n=1 Tax=Clostridium estertheticum TaxID=238834 RepID=A0A5N7J5Q9_9CLOT|nr:YerC/YecD family TrpR-related protein [Clostridium estertheticum]MBU3184085.1 TrpR-like protein YerC/YecD [Clostridium estertheticum]MPQ33421.1 TrpR-like protein YerC/YecD [Clostridium estertheticum]MPQ64079.1 TrpR-like protein YerC/YecD [Clostridium estertheticum]